MSKCMYNTQGKLLCTEGFVSTANICEDMTYFGVKNDAFQILEGDLPKVNNSIFTLREFNLLDPSPHLYEARIKTDIMNFENPTMVYRSHVRDENQREYVWVNYDAVGPSPDMPSNAMVRVCK